MPVNMPLCCRKMLGAALPQGARMRLTASRRVRVTPPSVARSSLPRAAIRLVLPSAIYRSQGKSNGIRWEIVEGGGGYYLSLDRCLC
jgi:hypothetical protein